MRGHARGYRWKVNGGDTGGKIVKIPQLSDLVLIGVKMAVV